MQDSGVAGSLFLLVAVLVGGAIFIGFQEIPREKLTGQQKVFHQLVSDGQNMLYSLPFYDYRWQKRKYEYALKKYQSAKKYGDVWGMYAVYLQSVLDALGEISVRMGVIFMLFFTVLGVVVFTFRWLTSLPASPSMPRYKFQDKRYSKAVFMALKYMRNSDAPASAKHHMAKKGGLYRHTLSVIKETVNNLKKSPEKYPNPDEAVLLAAFHDLGKLKVYRYSEKNKTWYHTGASEIAHTLSMAREILRKAGFDEVEVAMLIRKLRAFVEKDRQEYHEYQVIRSADKKATKEEKKTIDDVRMFERVLSETLSSMVINPEQIVRPVKALFKDGNLVVLPITHFQNALHDVVRALDPEIKVAIGYVPTTSRRKPMPIVEKTAHYLKEKGMLSPREAFVHLLPQENLGNKDNLFLWNVEVKYPDGRKHKLKAVWILDYDALRHIASPSEQNAEYKIVSVNPRIPLVLKDDEDSRGA